MSEPTKVAYIGCGGITGAHLKGFADLHGRGWRGMAVTACCDLNQASAAQRAQEFADVQGSPPQVFTNVEALLAADVAEAAIITVPHWLHHSVAIAALKAGLHVMVEKPIGITVKASKKIIAAGKKAGRVVATAEQVRRLPSCRAFRWAIAEKKMIGEVRAVHTSQVMNNPLDLSKPAMRWRAVKLLTGGGMIMDSGAHYADMMQHMFGEPDTVYCVTRNHDGRIVENAPTLGNVPADVETAWHAMIHFHSGIDVVWLYSRHYYGAPAQVAQYFGTHGTIRSDKIAFHPFQGGGTIFFADGREMNTEQVVAEYMASLSADQKERLFPLGCENAFGIQTWDFIEAIRQKRPPEMDGEAGLRAKTLSEACFESAEAGKPVKYADVLSGRTRAFQKPIDAHWGI